MIRRCLLLFVSILILLAPPAYADLKTANRQTFFNNTTDYFATIGKDGRDKKEILNERRTTRRQARLQAEARRQRVLTRKRMQAQQNTMMRKINARSE